MGQRLPMAPTKRSCPPPVWLAVNRDARSRFLNCLDLPDGDVPRCLHRRARHTHTPISVKLLHLSTSLHGGRATSFPCCGAQIQGSRRL